MNTKIKISNMNFILIYFFIISVNPDLFSESTISYITTDKAKGVFTIAEDGKAAPIFVSSEDFLGVHRVIKHLRQDITSVTNTQPEIRLDSKPFGEQIIIAGTLGRNPLIDELAKNKKLNVVEIAGKWETFLTQVIENPFPNIKSALVVVGSDKRGTIYGIYDLTEKLGVSPWYWWADVPVKKKSKVYVLPGCFTMGQPKVKYRGIFINDEAPALSGWSIEKFGTGAFNHKLYERVFELILRLKGNFLWPAMWGRAFYDDDSLNPKLAEEYGVVIGTSHHEPMMRAHVEWSRYGSGPWNYEKNTDKLREFWRKGIERMGNNENIVTLAMRGDGDEAMGEDANIEVLEKIVHDQREIIKEVTGKNIENIPQVWALYKEVQEYYDKGMRVPDDVTILLCDDNWGNLRKLPKLNEKPRAGGYGIYYHFDYVGGPRNYKWLNTIQIERVWEQMHLAYEYGARQIWIANVGDIKPMEFPIDFFLDYAWNPENYTPENLQHYYKDWAEVEFGQNYSEEIAELLSKYTKYNSRRKPELLSPETYSLINYREAETVVDKYNQLAEKSEKLYKSISHEYKDSYYQLVHHPITACANLNELYITTAKNHLYFQQGRTATNQTAERVKELFKKDAEITDYYNNTLANGKWKHMMDQTHIGYTYWQQPDTNQMPKVKLLNIPDAPGMGVSIEFSDQWFPKNDSLILPEFDKFNPQSCYIEIFNRGIVPFTYAIGRSDSWIEISEHKGEIETQKRIWISIDWKSIPAGKFSSSFTIQGSEGSKATIHIKANNYSIQFSEEFNGHLESNGFISIEAQNYSKAVNRDGMSWKVIPNLGRTHSAITLFPVTSHIQKIRENSPRLEYQFYLFNQGEINVHLFFSPTLNFYNNPDGIRYAISIDNQQSQIVNMTNNPNPPDLNYDHVWDKWVADNINISVTKHKIEKTGEHVLKIWMVDPGVVLQKIIIDSGGLRTSYLGPPESHRRSK